MPPHPDVAVIGGGVIGLAIGWRCRQLGLDVTVYDAAPGLGASHTAAGMLAAVTELAYGETDLLRLNVESAARYPAFVDELCEYVPAGLIGYRRNGPVEVAWDAADLAYLRDLQLFQRSLGLDSEMVTGRQLRQLEPLLAPGLPGGLLASGDHQVDSRGLTSALLAACRATGVRLVAERVEGLVVDEGRVRALHVGGDVYQVGHVVLAAGAWSGRLDGIPPTVLPAVRPVKGQTLRLHSPNPPLLGHVVRGKVKGTPIYLVARENGEIVVGATSEEQGFDTSPRAGGVYELLRDATALVPIISECQWGEVSTGLRPGTPGNTPVIGASALTGLTLAYGHYRNGILLTPITADAVARQLRGEAPERWLEPFAPKYVPTAQASPNATVAP